MSTLKSKKTTYEFSLNEIKALIAKDMEIPVAAVSIDFNMVDHTDDRFCTTPDYRVDSITVTIDETKIN